MFKFKLNALFKVRKKEKDMILKAWTLQLGKLKIMNDDKVIMYNQYKENKIKYMGFLQTGDSKQALIMQAYLDSFKLKFRMIEQKINKQQAVIEQLRERVQVVSTDFKIIEKYKETKLKEYNDNLKKVEEKFNDEISVIRSQRRGKKFGSI